MTIKTLFGKENRTVGIDVGGLGLSSAEALASRQKYGKNVLPKQKRESFFKKFLKNLGDPIIRILLFALLIHVIFMFRDGNIFESVGIGISVLLATFISTMSEYSSESAFSELSKYENSVLCRVVRDGRICEIGISELVVGDVVIVSSGEQIPADGEIISGRLMLDQSSMTGENGEVEKSPLPTLTDTSPASRNYLHRGSLAVSGEGVIRVREVGEKTLLGGISREIQSGTRESPLKIRLTRLAKQISTIGYIAAALVGIFFLFNELVMDSAFDMDIIKYKLGSLGYVLEKLLEAFTLALTIVVVAVPEGLPMMIAVVLSSNVKRMVRDNVLVKKPVGIEAAGSMNILFTDKTGTLTCGKPSLDGVYVGDVRCELAALSYEMKGHFLMNAYYNTQSRMGKDERGDTCALGGNSTDRVLLSAVVGETRPEATEIFKMPFSSEKKYSFCSVKRNGREFIYIKGAAEVLKSKIRSSGSLDGKVTRFDRAGLERRVSTLAAGGKRVIIIGVCDANYTYDELESGNFTMTLLFVVTLCDKIRPEARDSVARLTRAGIKCVMITGDSKDTAASIAKECGIINKDQSVVLESSEMAKMSDMALKETLPRLAVVARALPSDKSRLIRIAEELDLVCGMTGDGINDAPALKLADVGFAMGDGTQVAKDAGDVVILDNNLKSIVSAVKYGRNVFKSIRKFITLQLMMNFCAVGVCLLCPLLKIDNPVTVVQMLWINIIMDTLGGLAFAGEWARESVMDEKPKRRDERILNGYMINQIVITGCFTVFLCISFLKNPFITSLFRYSPDNIYLLTAFFALFIFMAVINCFGARVDRLKLFSGLSKNLAFTFIMALILIIQIAFIYVGGTVLRTAPLTVHELAVTAIISLLIVPFELVRKLIWRMIFGKKGY